MQTSGALRSSHRSPAVDPWSGHFEAVAADRLAERQRLKMAALGALAVHLVLFAISWPTSPFVISKPPQRLVFPLNETRFHPRPPEPTPVVPVTQPMARQPTIAVPGPPEPDIVTRFEIVAPVVVTAVPQIDPVALLPIEAPPVPAAEPPVPYDASIERPQRLFAPLPEYTPIARRVGREGSVVLEAVIDATGAVVEVQVVRGLGMGLDESALAAVSSWRFEPARRHGRAIAVIYHLVVNFQLN